MFEFLDSIPVIGGILSFWIPTFIVLGFVVAIHEYGHYIVGKWCGIGAEVFSIGMGKPLWSRYDKHGTKWQIAAIPFGGYVKFLGDVDAASTQGKENLNQLSHEEAARHFPTAALWRKTLTVLAGPVANFILSFVIFTALALTYGRFVEEPIVGKVIQTQTDQFDIQVGDKILAVEGVPISSFLDLSNWSREAQANDRTIYSVERDGDVIDVSGPFPSPAYISTVHPVSSASSTGLKQGDFILSLDGVSTNSFRQLQDVVAQKATQTMPIVIQRGTEKLTFSITPREQEFEDADGKIIKRVLLGISGGNAFEPMRESATIGQAMKSGVERTWGVIWGSMRGIYLMFAGEISAKNLQGPVGIAHMSSDVAQAGWLSLLALIGVISTAIGFLNLLPIPIMDGGHLTMFAYQAISGKPVGDKFVRIASIISLSLLLTLMLFSTTNDLVRLFQ